MTKTIQRINGVDYTIEVAEDGTLKGTPVKEKTAEDLVRGDDYYVLTPRGYVNKMKWSNDDIDHDHRGMGAILLTQEQAIFKRDQQLFLAKMARDFKKNSERINWDNKNQSKYALFYNPQDKTIGVSLYTYLVRPNVTTNRGWLEMYAHEHKNNLLKYYFELGGNK